MKKVGIFFFALMCLAACGGDTSVDIDNENQQSQGGGSSYSDSAEACAACVGNPEDDMSDRECLANSGFTLADCE